MATRRIPASVELHPLFKRIAQFVRIEKYDRDGGHSKPRIRIEVATTMMPPNLIREMLKAEVQCVRCGQPIHPFRARTKGSSDRTELPRHVYVAVACPLDVNIGCSRGKAAKEAYIAIEEAVENA